MATTKCNISIEKGSLGTKFHLFKLEHGFGFVNRPIAKKRAVALGSSWDIVRIKGDLVLLKHPKNKDEYIIVDGQHRIYCLSESNDVTESDRVMTATIHDTINDFPVTLTACSSRNAVHRYFYALNSKNAGSILTAGASAKIGQRSGECKWTPVFKKAGLLDTNNAFQKPGPASLTSVINMQVRLDDCISKKRITQMVVSRNATEDMMYIDDPSKFQKMANFLNWWNPIATRTLSTKGATKLPLWGINIMPIIFLIWNENQDKLNTSLAADRLVPLFVQHSDTISAALGQNNTLKVGHIGIIKSIQGAINAGRRRKDSDVMTPLEVTLFGKSDRDY